MSGMNKKGITLIELIIFIIVGAIFLPLAYVAFTSAVNNSMKPETAAMTRALAEGKVTDITKDPYDNVPVPATYTHTSNGLYTYCSAVNSPDVNYYCEVPNIAGFRWKWRIDYVAYTNTAGVTKIETPPNWTPDKNPPYNIGDYVKPSGFPASPYNHFYRVYFPQWESGANYAINDYVRVTDGTFYRRLPPAPWDDVTAYVIGNYAHPTANENFFYRVNNTSCWFFYVTPAILSDCSACSGSSEPTWAASINEWRTCQANYYLRINWVEDTSTYNALTGSNVPSCSPPPSNCVFVDANLRWQRTTPSLVSGNAGSFDFSSYTTPNGIEFNDNGVRWKESTVYKQINVYILPPGCSIGQPCEYIFTTITTAKNYTPGTGRP
jgi:hypothetical protein